MMPHPPLWWPVAVVIGLVLGSFYTVCIHRYLTDGSIVFPPSHCPRCRARLRWHELVPLLSYLALRGRCAHCRAPISPRYPLVELCSAVLTGLLAWRYGFSETFFVYLFFSGILIVASGIDLAVLILPDRLTLSGAMAAAPCAVFVLGHSLEETILGGIVGGGALWLIGALYEKAHGREGMGLGDAKLMLLLGSLCGFFALPYIFLFGSVAALCAFPLFARLSPDTELSRICIPFGPFLAGGALAYVCAG